MASHIPLVVLQAMHARTRGETVLVPGWTLTKQTPKTAVWARSRHGAARVTHRIRYLIEAVEKNPAGPPVRQPIKRGLRSMMARHYVLVVWVCGGRASDWRGVEIMPGWSTVHTCWGCRKPRA